MLKKKLEDPGAILRKRFSSGCVLLPGVFNAISALSACSAGASGLYISGAGVTNGSLGVPDIGLATLAEFVDHANKICSVVDLPVISDADTGFGEAWNVNRAVLELESSGLAGIHLEDQVNPKRCGHLDGKAVIESSAMAAKLKAAVDAKVSDSFLIIARTDARGVEGLDSAIHRARIYKDAGADAIFPEGLQSVEEFARFRDEIDLPLLANMTEFGKTPLISFSEFAGLGYQMVIYPMTAFRVMLKALETAYGTLIQEGSQESLLPLMKTRAELYSLLEYSEYEESDRNWAKLN